MEHKQMPPPLELSQGEEEYFRQLFETMDQEKNGMITFASLRDFFKATLLPSMIIKQICEMVDPENRGFMLRNEFFKCLRLISHAQEKKTLTSQLCFEPCSLPKFRRSMIRVGPVPPAISNLSSGERGEGGELDSPTVETPKGWYMTYEEKDRYKALFRELAKMSDTIDGVRMREFFLQSGLPPPVLSQIWKLSDLNGDGELNEDEFSIALHLIYAKIAGQEIPATLPPSLLTPSPTPASKNDEEKNGRRSRSNSQGNPPSGILESGNQGRTSNSAPNVFVGGSEVNASKSRHNRSVSVDPSEFRQLTFKPIISSSSSSAPKQPSNPFFASSPPVKAFSNSPPPTISSLSSNPAAPSSFSASSNSFFHTQTSKNSPSKPSLSFSTSSSALLSSSPTQGGALKTPPIGANPPLFENPSHFGNPSPSNFAHHPPAAFSNPPSSGSSPSTTPFPSNLPSNLPPNLPPNHPPAHFHSHPGSLSNSPSTSLSSSPSSSPFSPPLRAASQGNIGTTSSLSHLASISESSSSPKKQIFRSPSLNSCLVSEVSGEGEEKGEREGEREREMKPKMVRRVSGDSSLDGGLVTLSLLDYKQLILEVQEMRKEQKKLIALVFQEKQARESLQQEFEMFKKKVDGT